MKIEQLFFNNSLRNFCYLVTFEDGTIFCIDPFESTLVIKELHERKLTAILNTHDHCDHHSGNKELVAKYNCLVMAHTEAIIPCKTKGVSDRDIIYKFGDWRLIAIDSPGHTFSHLCFLIEKAKKPFALFTGDCFFNAGVGNCHNGGSPEVMYKTISEIFEKWPDDLLIYPGHEYLKRNLEFSNKYEPKNQKVLSFLKNLENINLNEKFFINTMKMEREINPFLRLESTELRSNLNCINKDNKQVFLTLRELRNKW